MSRARLLLVVTLCVFLPCFALSELVRWAAGYTATGRFHALAALSSLGAALLGYLTARAVFQRSIARPVEELGERVAALSAGALATAHPLQRTGAREVDRLIDANNELLAALRARVADAEAGRVEFRRAITRVGDALASSNDRAAILQVVLEMCVLVTRAAGGIFWLPRSGIIAARFRHGATGEAGDRLGVEPGRGLAGWVAVNDLPRVVGRADLATGVEPDVDTALAIPVHSRGRVFGVVAVYGRVDGLGVPFAEDELLSLAALVTQAEGAIENTFLHEEMNRRSLSDFLTGVWNRRHFDRRLIEEIDRTTRFGEPVSIVLLDLDRFKDVNDTYGHPAGDAVLVEIARRLLTNVRQVDVVSRYGGEEFGIVLPRTDVEGAYRVAQKLRAAVEGSAIKVPGSSEPIDMTVSVGVAGCPDHGREASVLVAAADAALYRAKADGKNRVETARR